MSAPCYCATYDDGSTLRSHCPTHADSDPCYWTAAITRTRRKGTIRRGVCTSCGWTEPGRRLADEYGLNRPAVVWPAMPGGAS